MWAEFTQSGTALWPCSLVQTNPTFCRLALYTCTREGIGNAFHRICGHVSQNYLSCWKNCYLKAFNQGHSILSKQTQNDMEIGFCFIRFTGYYTDDLLVFSLGIGAYNVVIAFMIVYYHINPPLRDRHLPPLMDPIQLGPNHDFSMDKQCQCKKIGTPSTKR